MTAHPLSPIHLVTIRPRPTGDAALDFDWWTRATEWGVPDLTPISRSPSPSEMDGEMDGATPSAS